jgi:RNA polymerase sigma factor (sigma-70 family)
MQAGPGGWAINPFAVNPADLEAMLQQAKRMDRDAFLGEALLAVVLAAQRYRPELGVPFLSYGAHQVRYALLGEARRQDPISQWRRARLREGRDQERPSDLPVVSLEALLAGGEGVRTEWEVDLDPGPEARALAADQRRRLWEALGSLNPRYRSVLHLRYWEGQTQTAVARALGVSAARVYQIERDALLRLRRELQEEELPA